MVPRRHLTAALAFAVGLCFAQLAHADEQSDFDKGRAAYEAKNYEDADKRFRTMLDPATGSLKDAGLIKQARAYWAAVEIGLKRPKEANGIFEKLLLEDASFEPDPLSFPSSVIDAFLETRANMRERLNAAAVNQAKRDVERRAREDAEKKRQVDRLRTLEKMASEEIITRTHSRWVAMLPFGAGQFQNGQPALGWAFATTQVALIAAGLVTYPIYFNERSKAFARYTAGDIRGYSQYLARAETPLVLNGVFYGGAALVDVIGIVQAQLAFVPQVLETKKRAVPVSSIKPTILPLIAPVLEGRGIGGIVGVTGRF